MYNSTIVVLAVMLSFNTDYMGMKAPRYVSGSLCPPIFFLNNP